MNNVKAIAKKLIQFKSVNPPGREKEIAEYIKVYLKRIGMKVQVIGSPERPNIIARKRFSKGKKILLNGHMDVVPAYCWKINPFKPSEKNGRIYGRGASDMKGGLACMLIALKNLIKNNLKGEIIFIASCDEEKISERGMKLIKKQDKACLKADLAIIGEPSNMKIVAAEKGIIRMKLLLKGKSAHGGYPEMGINAISKAAKIISAIENLKFDYKPNLLLSKPSLNIGKIIGGEKINIVPQSCEIEFEVRYTPRMNASHIKRKITGEIEKIKKIDKGKWSFKLKIIGHVKPSESDLKLCKKLGKRLNLEVIGANYATDARFMDCPFIILGPGEIEKMHTENESVKIENLIKCEKLYENIIIYFLNCDKTKNL